MDSVLTTPAPRRPWPLLWLVALVSLIIQLALCQFFTFGAKVPWSIDVNPSNLWKYADHFPPRGEFLTLNWLGLPNLPPTLNPFSLAAAHLPVWLFFTTYAPLIGTAALLAMVLFLRELDLPRPAALLGGVVYAWQGDLLPFVFPGHYGYITTWPFYALGAWAALRADRHWGHALIAGASCGMMIGLQPDRGSIASLLIGAIYLAPVLAAAARSATPAARLAELAGRLRPLAVCIGTALLVSLAGFLALFQSNIEGVKLGGASDRDQLFSVATQYSLHPVETFSYLAPGFFGWSSSSAQAPYWGWIGQAPGYSVNHEGARNLNLAISTTGTAATLLGVLGAALLVPGAPRFFGLGASRLSHAGATNPAAAFASTFTPRQLFFGRLLLILGLVSLVLSWGYHTPFYRPLFALPLMDKWRNPLKWLEIFNFTAVVLSAYGTAHVLRSLTDATQRHALNLYFAVMVGLLLVFLLASYPIAIAVTGFLAAEQYTPLEVANIMHILHVSLAFAFVIGGALWLKLVGMWHGDLLQQWDIVNPWLRRQWQWLLTPARRPGTLAAGLAGVVVVQLAWVSAQFLLPTSLAGLTATNPLLQSLRAEGQLVRVAVPQPQDSLLNFYLQNQFAADRISSIDISAASRIPDALSAFVGAFDGHTARLWLLGGVKNVAIAQTALTTLRQDPEIAANIAAADGYTLGPAPADQPTHALVRLRDYFTKATFVPAAELPGDDDAILKRLSDPKWNPRASVLLASSGAGALRGPLPPHGISSLAPAPDIDVTRYTPHQIDFALTAPVAGYVLINDQFDPDWQATVNGKPTPLLRADYLLRAVAVPPGDCAVTLRYAAHYRVAWFALPTVVVNDFSDGVMLTAFIAGAWLIRPRQTPKPEIG